MTDWIDLPELCARERLTPATVRRLVRRRLVSFRRSGPGVRAPLEFNYPVVHQQLKRLLERDGKMRSSAPEEAPTIFTVLSEVRELRAALASLAEQLARQMTHFSEGKS